MRCLRITIFCSMTFSVGSQGKRVSGTIGHPAGNKTERMKPPLISFGNTTEWETRETPSTGITKNTTGSRDHTLHVSTHHTKHQIKMGIHHILPISKKKRSNFRKIWLKTLRKPEILHNWYFCSVFSGLMNEIHIPCAKLSAMGKTKNSCGKTVKDNFDYFFLVKNVMK